MTPSLQFGFVMIYDQQSGAIGDNLFKIMPTNIMVNLLEQCYDSTNYVAGIIGIIFLT